MAVQLSYGVLNGDISWQPVRNEAHPPDQVGCAVDILSDVPGLVEKNKWIIGSRI